MKIDVLDTDLSLTLGEPIYLAPSDLETVGACPVCDSRASQQLLGSSEGRRRRGVTLSHCAHCSHSYLSTRPSAPWYEAYYEEDWDTGRLPQAVKPSRLRRFLKSYSPLRRAVRLGRLFRKGEFSDVKVHRILSMFSGMGPLAEDFDALPKNPKVLEIGAGYGGALELISLAGFEAYGTEANRYRVEVCRAKGLNVFLTDIDNFEPVGQFAPFDFIYSSHVFEHLLDLQRIMTGLAPLLKEDGSICIEVPHGPVAEDIVRLLHQPGHCHIFSARSLATLLHRHGFTVSRVLADVNLLVTACKNAGNHAFPALNIEAEPEDLVPWRHALAGAAGPITYAYDHFYAIVRRKGNGSTLFTRETPYSIRPLCRPGTADLIHTFTLEVKPETIAEDWPIRFVHQTDSPPIWMKRQ